jgi:cyclophilin family peptidyl-prolyl cis-trans isomerase
MSSEELTAAYLLSLDVMQDGSGYDFSVTGMEVGESEITIAVKLTRERPVRSGGDPVKINGVLALEGASRLGDGFTRLGEGVDIDFEKFDANGEETGNPRYWEKIPAEINFPQLYHRRGALAAAREGDFVNPERKSSRTQFYIVWGRTFDAEQLARMEQRLAMQGITLPDNVREAYMNEGGTPHLDGQYTVFGEVLQGLDVVDKIQQMATDKNHRPLADVRILRATAVVDPFAPKPAPKKPQPVAPKRRRK